MRRVAIVAVVGLFGVPACEGPCAPGDGDPTLEIGQGEQGFEPLDADEPQMEIIHGPQGGWHVAVALEATGLDGDDLMSSHLEGWVDGELVGETQPWVHMRCNPNTKTLQSWNNLLVWDVPPEELHGRIATVEVEIADLDGRSASDSVDVTLYDPLLDTGGG